MTNVNLDEIYITKNNGWELWSKDELKRIHEEEKNNHTAEKDFDRWLSSRTWRWIPFFSVNEYLKALYAEIRECVMGDSPADVISYMDDWAWIGRELNRLYGISFDEFRELTMTAALNTEEYL